MPIPLHTSAAQADSAVSQRRLFALDTARFIAIIGMVAAHVSLIPIPGFSLIVDGPPSTLFAVLGGASAVLATQGRVARSGRMGASLSLITRGLLLIVLGYALQFVSGPIAIVLIPFGVTLILLAPLLRVPTRALLVVVAGLAVAGPVANHAFRAALGLDTVGDLSFDSPWAFLHSVTFTGTYPVVTWLTYALIGVIVIRAALAARASGAGAEFGRRLMLWGLVSSLTATLLSIVAVQFLTVPRLAELGLDEFSAQLIALMPSFGGPVGGGLEAVFTAAPHSGSTGDIVRTSGLALAVIGALLRREAVAGVSQSLPARIVRAGGAAPLTLYVVHVLTFGALSTLLLSGASAAAGPTWLVQGVGAFALQFTLLVGVSVVLAVSGRRGPLEAALSELSLRAASSAPAPYSRR